MLQCELLIKKGFYTILTCKNVKKIVTIKYKKK